MVQHTVQYVLYIHILSSRTINSEFSSLRRDDSAKTSRWEKFSQFFYRWSGRAHEHSEFRMTLIDVKTAFGLIKFLSLPSTFLVFSHLPFIIRSCKPVVPIQIDFGTGGWGWCYSVAPRQFFQLTHIGCWLEFHLFNLPWLEGPFREFICKAQLYAVMSTFPPYESYGQLVAYGMLGY